MTRWIFVSDLQLRPDDPGHEERRRLLIERVAAEKPDFVIDGGDHVAGAVNDEPEEAERVALMWAAYHRVTMPLRGVCPVISTVGNHDQTGSDPSSEEFLRQVGRQGRGTWHAGTIGNVHIAILDVLNGRHRGGFSDRAQTRWLRRDLRASRRAPCTVVAGHYPVLVSPWLREHSVLRDEEPGDPGVLLPMLPRGGRRPVSLWPPSRLRARPPRDLDPGDGERLRHLLRRHGQPAGRVQDRLRRAAELRSVRPRGFDGSRGSGIGRRGHHRRVEAGAASQAAGLIACAQNQANEREGGDPGCSGM